MDEWMDEWMNERTNEWNVKNGHYCYNLQLVRVSKVNFDILKSMENFNIFRKEEISMEASYAVGIQP